MSIERMRSTSCVHNRNDCQYATVCEIFTVELCMTLTLTFRIGQDQNINMPIEKPHATCVGNSDMCHSCHRL